MKINNIKNQPIYVIIIFTSVSISESRMIGESKLLSTKLSEEMSSGKLKNIFILKNSYQL